jgi:hypothetical protein
MRGEAGGQKKIILEGLINAFMTSSPEIPS